MAKYARILDGLAVDVITGSPNGRYHPSLVSQFQTVPNGVVEGSRLVAGSWQQPVAVEPPPAPQPQPLALTYNQFVTLALTAGSMTPAAYAEARSNPALIVYFDMLMQAQGIQKDDPQMTMGAAAFVDAELLTQSGWDAMQAAWPTA
jgi:hypothetical protein